MDNDNTDVDDMNNTETEAAGGGIGPRIAAYRDYFAEADPNAMRAELEEQIRNHPIASMAIAVLGGFLLAKIVD